MQNSSIAMICCTCLASNRRLSHLGQYQKLLSHMGVFQPYSSLDLFTEKSMICWECKASIRNMNEFLLKAQNAQIQMQMLYDGVLLKPLSKLNITKDVFKIKVEQNLISNNLILKEREENSMACVSDFIEDPLLINKPKQQKIIINSSILPKAISNLKTSRSTLVKHNPETVILENGIIKKLIKIDKNKLNQHTHKLVDTKQDSVIQLKNAAQESLMKTNWPLLEIPIEFDGNTDRRNTLIDTAEMNAIDITGTNTSIDTCDSKTFNSETTSIEWVTHVTEKPKMITTPNNNVIKVRKNTNTGNKKKSNSKLAVNSRVNMKLVPLRLKIPRNLETVSGAKLFKPKPNTKYFSHIVLDPDGIKIPAPVVKKAKEVNVNKSLRNLNAAFNPVDKFKLERMDDDELVKARDEVLNSPDFMDCRYKCVKCLFTFSSEFNLEKHMKHHEKRPNTIHCKLCTQYLTSSEYYAHDNRHYYKYNCMLCEHTSYFHTKKAWNHYEECHFDRFVKCDKCDDSFSSLKKFRAHYNDKHNVVGTCTKCNKGFSKYDTFKRHMRNHGPDMLYTCNKCGEKCQTKKEYVEHYKKVHPPRSMTTPGYCVECDLVFKHESLYRQHLNTKKHSSGSSTFQCDMCGKSFMSKNSCATHIKYYHVDPPKKCHLCNKTFYRRDKLVRHVKVAHEGFEVPKTHMCSVCGKGFTSRPLLKNHTARHLGERKFKCCFCPKDFAYSSALYTHKRLVHKVPRLKDLQPNQ